jgi:hypothetical protein
MTGYFDRDFQLAHDIASEKKMELWRRFEVEGRPGSFLDCLKLNQTYAENLHHERNDSYRRPNQNYSADKAG